MTSVSSGMKSNFATIILIVLGFCCLATRAQAGSLVSTDRADYRNGESVQVHYRGAPGYSRDWITIVRAGARHNEPGNWQYIPRNTNRGTLIFRSPPPGHYEVRAYYNYSAGRYRITSRSSFRVTH